MFAVLTFSPAVHATTAKTNDVANIVPKPDTYNVEVFEPAKTVYIVQAVTVEPVAYVETKTERSFFHAIKDYNYVSFVSATRPEEANVGWRRLKQ